MDRWPADTRSEKPAVQSKGKRKAKQSHAARVNYPSLRPGELGAATLREVDGRFEWTTIVDNDEETSQLVAQEAVTLYPASRPRPQPTTHIPVLQRAEQGANFVRTYFPDLDVEASLIRDELLEAGKQSESLSQFDPLAGNILDVVSKYDSGTSVSIHLAFPTGELGCDLNVSPLNRSKISGTVFKPVSRSTRTCATPIRQVACAKLADHRRIKNTFMGVRTFSSTFLYEIKSVDDDGLASLQDFATITTEQIGGDLAMDLKLVTHPFQVLIVNSRGTVYQVTNDRGHFAISLSHVSERENDDFWRLGLSQDQSEYLLMSSKKLHLLNKRDSPVTLFIVRDENERLTCIEDEAEDSLFRLCTTSQILWLDKRVPDKPLLACRHGRQFDRYLQTRTLNLNNHYVTFLFTRRNKLITIYDVYKDETGLLHLNTAPYCISGPSNNFMSGHAFIHQQRNKFQELCMVSLSEKGELLSSALLGSSPSRDWPRDIQSMSRASSTMRQDFGSLGARERAETDFSELYEKIFIEQRQEDQAFEEETAEEVYELFDRVPRFWQNAEVPSEHMLTTHDIVNRSKDEGWQTGRSDFLAENPLSSVRGFRSLAQGKLSADLVKRGARWHRDIGESLRCLEPDVTSDVKQSFEHLKQYDADGSEEHFADKALARQKLAVDLALSTDIFAPTSFVGTKDDALETMTEQLSISSEPPPVEFQYLRPVSKADHYSRANGNTESIAIPLGVRSLLQSWDIGSDPDKFIFRDPYADEEDAGNSPRVAGISPPTSRLDVFPASQPPRLATQKPKQPLLSESQPTVFPQSQAQPRSQDLASQEPFASTQILPGPFGGRPQAGSKKKPVKKRLGGF